MSWRHPTPHLLPVWILPLLCLTEGKLASTCRHFHTHSPVTCPEKKPYVVRKHLWASHKMLNWSLYHVLHNSRRSLKVKPFILQLGPSPSNSLNVAYEVVWQIQANVAKLGVQWASTSECSYHKRDDCLCWGKAAVSLTLLLIQRSVALRCSENVPKQELIFITKHQTHQLSHAISTV